MPPKRILLVSSVLLAALIGVIWFGPRLRSEQGASAQSCRLVVLDVGQGDAMLIQTPDHQDVLVDGGPSAAGIQQLGKYLGPGNNALEILILTHPDADHLTGALAALQEWPVETILTTGVVTHTALYHRWQAELKKTTASIIPVIAGQRYTLGQFLTIDTLWPDRSWDGVPYMQKASNGRGGINDTSIGAKITCAGSTALMIGDASDAVEKELLRAGANLHVDLLKIGHHGSKYSSTHEFLRAVQPDMAVIPVGAINHYGHPHPTVIERLRVLRIPVYRTDLQKTLLFKSVPGGWRYTP